MWDERIEICIECGREFLFTPDVASYDDEGGEYPTLPGRCPECDDRFWSEP